MIVTDHFSGIDVTFFAVFAKVQTEHFNVRSDANIAHQFANKPRNAKRRRNRPYQTKATGFELFEPERATNETGKISSKVGIDFCASKDAGQNRTKCATNGVNTKSVERIVITKF